MGVPPFGLRRQIFWSLVGAMITAGLLALALSFFGRHAAWTRAPVGILFAISLWFSSGRLAWRLARPLDRLVEAVQRFGKGDYAVRTGFPAGARSEAARVAHAIDEMAERIERQMKEEQQLLAVVSHELRMPLARIRALTDLARAGQETALAGIDREVSEADYLVSNLLARSRLEFGTVANRQIGLAEAISEALGRAGLDASLLDAPEEVRGRMVNIDPTLLHRAIANLIENAHRHGRGVERIEVRPTASGVGVSVLDRGPGFAHRDEGGQGLGIGMNLVRRIVASYGGTVWAEDRAGGGANVGFGLP